jgi:hypothetical protein
MVTYPPPPISRSYLQSVKEMAIQRRLRERADELAVLCAEFAVLKAKGGHTTARWSPTPDQLTLHYADPSTPPLTLSHEMLLDAIKLKMPDTDIVRYEYQGYIYYHLDWS